MIYLEEIYITNLLSMMLLFGIIASGSWKIADKYESKLIFNMLQVVGAACAAEVVRAFGVGMQGSTWHAIVYVANFWLFIANLVLGPTWVFLINHHMNGSNPRCLWIVTIVLLVIGICILLVNIYQPIIFSLDSINRYRREKFYLVYILIPLAYNALGIVLYLIRKIRFCSMRFFPVLQFIVPVVIGLIIHGFVYGISIVWPACSVGLAVMIISLQNEKVYMDQLTGVYNRTFLSKVEKERAHRGRFVMMMLDMNGFKQINDNYGHTEGDQALIAVGQILSRSLPRNGLVIRYAGDEFFVLFSARSMEDGEVVQKRIEQRFEDYNKQSVKPYVLSGSIGFGIYDLSDDTLDEILKDIDKRMYEQKEIYYKYHERRHKRRG